MATPMGRRAGLPSFGNPLEEYGRIRQGFYIPYEIVNPVDRTGGLAITALARTTMTVNELQEDANPHGIELVELALRAARLRE